MILSGSIQIQLDVRAEVREISSGRDFGIAVQPLVAARNAVQQIVAKAARRGRQNDDDQQQRRPQTEKAHANWLTNDNIY